MKKTVQLTLLFTFFTCYSALSQVKISGKVKNPEGVPLIGVNIVEKGTLNGVITDVNGEFEINITTSESILEFSFIGYLPEEVVVGPETRIDILLIPDIIGMDEIVVIGYGIQKKANLTGATTTIKSKDLMTRPVSHGTALLQGRVAGLNIVQNSGQPGDEGLSINMRGIGSFDNSEPYVLIDGIEGSMAALNPNDIDKITVLKDAASAAIYGSRAANGVILVTTKSGKNNDMIIEASVNAGLQFATRLPDFIYNSVEYMELWNKGAEHTGVTARYPQEMIDAYRDAAPGDLRYPNFNWMEHMFSGGLRQDYQLSARGGGEKNAFFLNLGYIEQDGIVDKYGMKKYTTRLNLDFDMNKNISMGVKSGIAYRDIEEPTVESINEMMLYIYTMPPTMSPYTSDGTGHYTARDIPEIWRNRNPEMIVNNPGYTTYDKYEIAPQAYINVHPFEGFSWITTAAWRYDRTEKKHMYTESSGYVFSTNQFYGVFEQNDPGVYNHNYRSSNIFLNSVLTYNRTLLEEHELTIIAGYEQHEMNYESNFIRRPEYIDTRTSDINAGSPKGQEVFGNTSSWALQSLFGRLSYNFDGRYLFEGNIRYDGTSKIAEDNRWDFFPSMSVGWRVSEEDFMNAVSWVDNLKFRFSYGQLGNQSVLKDYPYQEVFSPTYYPLNGVLEPGVSNNKLPNPDLVWEKVISRNIGLDYSMMNGLFGIEADIYKKVTEGGHDVAQIPASVGKKAPQENYKNMENTGIELVLRHIYRIGDFNYNVSFIFDKYENKITRLKDNSWGNTFYGRSNVEGHPVNEYYMLDWIGVYQNQQQVDNLPIYEAYRKQTQPGDLIFRDANRDGEISVEGETGDRVFFKGYHPKFSYSFALNMEWKGIDLSMFWQGVAGKKNLARWIGYEPFMQGGPVSEKWRDAWDGEGSTHSMPAIYNLSNYEYLPVTGLVSDFYLHDASYLRLKNIQVGYTIPSIICSKIGVQKLRVYISGDNLITISDFEYDPERTSDNYTVNTFPQLKTYALGARLTF